jgi:hypothetical protein
MRHHRLLILLFAATLVTAAALAFTSAARANREPPGLFLEREHYVVQSWMPLA